MTNDARNTSLINWFMQFNFCIDYIIKNGQSFRFQIIGKRTGTKNLQSIIWLAGTTKVDCKKTKNILCQSGKKHKFIALQTH